MKSFFLWILRLVGVLCFIVSALIIHRFMPVLILENQLPERTNMYLRITKNTLPKELEDSVIRHLPAIYNNDNITVYEYARLVNNEYIGVLEFQTDGERVLFEESYLLSSNENIAYQAYKNKIYIASTGSILNELYNDKQPKLWDKETYKQLRYALKPSSAFTLWIENKPLFESDTLQNIASTLYPSTFLTATNDGIYALIKTDNAPFDMHNLLPYTALNRINSDIIRYSGYNLQRDYNTLEQQFDSINSDYTTVYNGLYEALTDAYIGNNYNFKKDVLPLLNSTYTIYMQPQITYNTYDIALEIPYNNDAETLINSINTTLLENDKVLQESVVETDIDSKTTRKELLLQEKTALEKVQYKTYEYTMMPQISYYTDNKTLIISSNNRFLERLLDSTIQENTVINNTKTHLSSTTKSTFEALSLLFPPSYNALTHSYNTSVLDGLYDYLLQKDGTIDMTITPHNGYNSIDIDVKSMQ